MPINAIPRYDTIIVGARCAGAFAALHLARGGQRVLVIDRDKPGTDTLSTHALMRLGVSLLDEADVLPQIIAAGTPAVRQTVFTYGGAPMPVDIAPLGRAQGLYAPRRDVLDRTLVDAARAAGATVIYRTSFEGLMQRPDGQVTGAILRLPDGSQQRVASDMVVGADGRTSVVAQAARAEMKRVSRNKTASIYTYVKKPDLDSYEWLFGRGKMAGLIPTNDGKACAFASVTPDELRSLPKGDPFAAIHRVFSECGAPEDLLPVAPVEKVRRFAGAAGHIRQACGNGWALIGDAGYFKDPCTAHGITDALRDARSLAKALLAGGPSAVGTYEEERDALSLPFFDLTDKIAALDWSMKEVQSLHMALHQVMRAEQEAVLYTPRKTAA